MLTATKWFEHSERFTYHTKRSFIIATVTNHLTFNASIILIIYKVYVFTNIIYSLQNSDLPHNFLKTSTKTNKHSTQMNNKWNTEQNKFNIHSLLFALLKQTHVCNETTWQTGNKFDTISNSVLNKYLWLVTVIVIFSISNNL